MSKNIGAGERWTRVFIGLVILGLGIFWTSAGPVGQWILGIVGAEVILTGIFGWSPVYQLFNIHLSSSSSHSVSHY